MAKSISLVVVRVLFHLLNYLLLFSNDFASCQIHRAISYSSFHAKYDLEATAQQIQNNYVNDENSTSFLNNSKMNETTTTTTNLGASDLIMGCWSLNSKKVQLIASVLGSITVGLSGIFPVAILPRLAQDHSQLIKSNIFMCLISFAAGSLLGDVFIHLLPESYSFYSTNDSLAFSNGIWTLLGFFIFFSIEKVFPDDNDDKEKENEQAEKKLVKRKVGRPKKVKKEEEKITDNPKFSILNHMKSIKIMGILNLTANIVDNFTHGIAVAGSFQASLKFGLMTLFATLLHEIPHEVGDFVILLKSGLSYKQAACAQLITSFSGVFGALFAMAFSTAEKAGDATSWILPFTSGGFLFIALVEIVPDLLKENNPIKSLKQVLSMILGIFVIYTFSLVLD